MGLTGEPPLTDDAVAILEFHESTTVSLTATKLMAGLRSKVVMSERTFRTRLSALVELDFLVRSGEGRKGTVITPQGRKYLDRMRTARARDGRKTA